MGCVSLGSQHLPDKLGWGVCKGTSRPTIKLTDLRNQGANGVVTLWHFSPPSGARNLVLKTCFDKQDAIDNLDNERVKSGVGFETQQLVKLDLHPERCVFDFC